MKKIIVIFALLLTSFYGWGMYTEKSHLSCLKARCNTLKTIKKRTPEQSAEIARLKELIKRYNEQKTTEKTH